MTADMSSKTERESKGLLTYRGAADLLNLQLGTLYAKVSRGEIPHIRLGRRLVRFDRAELLAWVERHRIPAATEGWR